MSDFYLEVARLPVRLVGLDGASFSAQLFLHKTDDHPSGRETLGERLNRPHVRFVPFEVDGRVELVNLRWVAYVQHDQPLPEVAAHADLGGRREPVRIRLRSGELLDGDLLYLFTGDGNRVLDRVNSNAERFLLLVSGDTSRYVNVDAVASLRT